MKIIRNLVLGLCLLGGSTVFAQEEPCIKIEAFMTQYQADVGDHFEITFVLGEKLNAAASRVLLHSLRWPAAVINNTDAVQMIKAPSKAKATLLSMNKDGCVLTLDGTPTPRVEVTVMIPPMELRDLTLLFEFAKEKMKAPEPSPTQHLPASPGQLIRHDGSPGPSCKSCHIDADKVGG